MSDRIKKRVRFIYGIWLSVTLIVTGILLILSCVSIYKSGNRPFTVKNISEAFDKIKIVIYIALDAIAGGILLNLIFTEKRGKDKAGNNRKMTLARLEKKVDITLCDRETRDGILKEKKFRMISRIVLSVICVGIFVPTSVYALNFDNYSLEQYNASIIAICIWLIPCSFIVMGLCLAFSFIEKASLDRHISLLKSANASGATLSKAEEKAENKWARALMFGSRIAIFAIALFFIIEGVTNGGASDVFIKAVNICTECIGLG